MHRRDDAASPSRASAFTLEATLILGDELEPGGPAEG
jgi:hypothetical protein